MNKINVYDGKKIKPMNIGVKNTGGDTFDYPMNLDTEVKVCDSKFGLYRDNLKKSNIGGEMGVIPCRQVNISTGRKEAIEPEYSYRVHQGLARGTSGMLNMPFVNRNAPLIPAMDSFNPGIESRVF
jgi:hypothetical protein